MDSYQTMRPQRRTLIQQNKTDKQNRLMSLLLDEHFMYEKPQEGQGEREEDSLWNRHSPINKLMN